MSICILLYFFSYRFKKRLSILLHTHVALIGLCTLSVLDAGCVIGQIISDILIMKGRILIIYPSDYFVYLME